MESTLLARQAIYDKNLNVVSYELLFRSNEFNEADLREVEPSVATSTVISNAIINLGITDIVNNLPAHINFSQESLQYLDVKPFYENLVVEIAMPEEIDEQFMTEVATLKKNNYKIALDGFTSKQSKLTNELIAFSDILKVDANALQPPELESLLVSLESYRGKLCANKLESKELYNYYQGKGFDLFQGYFLSYPNKVKGKSVAQNKLLLLQILAKLQDSDIEIDEVSHLISRDAVLCYKILRIVNSALHSAADRNIDSVNEAIIRLGLDKIKFWTSLIVLSTVNDNSMGIIEITLVRAQMCRNLAKARGYDESRQNTFFTIGLLSSLDALLDEDMAIILKKLPLAKELNNALLHHEGELGETLETIFAYQRSDFDSIDFSVMGEEAFSEAYINSIQWSDEMLRAFARIN